jgi:hypothetical protein
MTYVTHTQRYTSYTCHTHQVQQFDLRVDGFLEHLARVQVVSHVCDVCVTWAQQWPAGATLNGSHAVLLWAD